MLIGYARVSIHDQNLAGVIENYAPGGCAELDCAGVDGKVGRNP